MDLATLAGLVVGGVSLVVLVTHLTGGTVRATFASQADVRQAWALDDPSPVAAVQLSDDRHAALVQTVDGHVGVVYAMGDRWASRRVRHAHSSRAGLTLQLGDVGAPAIQFRLADADACTRWIQHLET